MALWGKKKNKETDPDTREERKKGIFRRLWHWIKNINWKDPVTRWKLMFASIITLIVIGAGGYGVIAFTNSPTFCKACHEMAPEHTTYVASSHSNLTCVQCHIKPGAVTMVLHKMKSLKEVYYHVTGIPEQIVSTVDEAVSDENCLQCHSKNRLVTASGDLKVDHKGHIEEGVPCISCHAGVAHGKIGVRKLNTEKDRDKYTEETGKLVMTKEYTDPNMGTCIDCHDKVNNGEKPWKDTAYLVPKNPEEEKEKTEEVNSKKTTDIAATTETTEAKISDSAVQDEKTQDIILQAIGKQQKDVKLSMACETCHKQIKVPENHKVSDWSGNHGSTAIQQLDKCLNCHQDSKWIKDVPTGNLDSIIKSNGQDSETSKYTPNLTVGKEQTRNNQFCSACHANRPASHDQSNYWLTGHALNAKTAEQKAECFVCHDREKPADGSTEAKAPTDIYCQYCHRTGFKSDVQ